jgi:hypothetical protein
MRATCHAAPILRDLIVLIIFRDEDMPLFGPNVSLSFPKLKAFTKDIIGLVISVYRI